MDIKAASNAFVEGAHSDGIWSANWKGNEIVTSGLDGTVKLWNVSNNNINNDISIQHKATAIIEGGDKAGIQSVVLSPEKVERGDNNNRVCVSCSQAGNIDIFDVLDDSLEHFKRIDAGIVEAWSVCINPEADAIGKSSQIYIYLYIYMIMS